MATAPVGDSRGTDGLNSQERVTRRRLDTGGVAAVDEVARRSFDPSPTPHSTPVAAFRRLPGFGGGATSPAARVPGSRSPVESGEFSAFYAPRTPGDAFRSSLPDGTPGSAEQRWAMRSFVVSARSPGDLAGGELLASLASPALDVRRFSARLAERAVEESSPVPGFKRKLRFLSK
jgi:hypothetical protein